MLLCPRCTKKGLLKRQTTKGFVFECARCEGRALSFELQKTIGGESAFAAFSNLLSQTTTETELKCPSCRSSMLGLNWNDARVGLEACRHCELTWFDRTEFDHYQKPVESGPKVGWVEQVWKLIPGVLRLPVETTNPIVSTPWMTSVLIGLMVAIHIVSSSNLDPLTERFGFFPNQFLRDGGLTLITSIFLHGSGGHLIVNSYCLFIFGDNLEDRFSHRFYLLLFFLSGIAGAIAHGLSDPRADVPLVGASGAISGLMTVYCLSFPKARLATFFLVGWLTYPAWAYALIWMGLQTIGFFQQAAGITMVSYAAHLGGALMGLIFYLTTRDRPKFKLR